MPLPAIRCCVPAVFFLWRPLRLFHRQRLAGGSPNDGCLARCLTSFLLVCPGTDGRAAKLLGYDMRAVSSQKSAVGFGEARWAR